MFSGIVTHIGQIAAIEDTATARRLTIEVNDTSFWACQALGHSIAVMGCCLTITSLGPDCATFDVSPETLRCTILGSLNVGDKVHLERALQLSARIHGHLVAGHVDGVGEVIARQTEGPAVQLQIKVPTHLAPYTAPKGSITVNGVSLTINAAGEDTFDVSIIPHTQAVTQLGHLAPQDHVNLEVDLMARYLKRLMSFSEVLHV